MSRAFARRFCSLLRPPRAIWYSDLAQIFIKAENTTSPATYVGEPANRHDLHLCRVRKRKAPLAPWGRSGSVQLVQSGPTEACRARCVRRLSAPLLACPRRHASLMHDLQPRFRRSAACAAHTRAALSCGWSSTCCHRRAMIDALTHKVDAVALEHSPTGPH